MIYANLNDIISIDTNAIYHQIAFNTAEEPRQSGLRVTCKIKWNI